MKTNHTPGPWRWEVSESSKRISLAGGVPRYDLTVMDFARWGMAGATPRFNTSTESGIMVMVPARELSMVIEGREHHADWLKTLSHPDALLMASSPDLLTALKSFVALAKNADDDGHFAYVSLADLEAEIEKAQTAITRSTESKP